MANEAVPTDAAINGNQVILLACEQCGERRFRSERGVMQHLRHCNAAAAVRQNEAARPPPPVPPPPLPLALPPEPIQQFIWGAINGNDAVRELKECYEEIVFWRKNLFMLPKGASGKDYIKETTRLINEWVADSPVKDCALYAIHVMPALLLQKPSKTSKSKDHVDALSRRLVKWKNGEFIQLLREAEALQKRLPKAEKKKNINIISRKFREHVSKGNLNSAIKLLSNNMEGGILSLNDETKALLKVKHPVAKKADEDVKLQGPLPTVENVIFWFWTIGLRCRRMEKNLNLTRLWRGWCGSSKGHCIADKKNLHCRNQRRIIGSTYGFSTRPPQQESGAKTNRRRRSAPPYYGKSCHGCFLRRCCSCFLHRTNVWS